MANRIDFQVGYTVDKAGLNEIQNALKQVQVEATKAAKAGNLTAELKDASKAAQQLQTILNDAWNSKLNQLDLSKLNNSIKTAYGSVEQLKTSFTLAGNAGSSGATAAATAYNKFASSVLNTNLQLKQSNKFLDEMATTMTNTVKWGVTSSIFNRITESIQQAYTYTKNLDSSLNDIRIVTDKSAESMETFAKQANSAAKALGASTLDYTEASLIYYQQGLSDKEAQARTETTLKAANVTGQTGEEVSDELTAVWNGYKVTAEETELYVDKLAAVAATTASDLEELSTGMSKVASAANNMGVDIDQLNGMMSTIISVTREAPESVGTALKTIFARMEDLELDGEDEYGVSLGTVSSSLESVGVQILDAQGNMRDLGEVIEEVGEKWNSGVWSDAEKQALAIDLAGKRQYNNLLSLFDNWDMYTSAVETSTDAVGTLQHQQDIYMESTAAHLEQLRTEFDRTYDIIFDQDVVNGMTDAVTGLLTVFNNFLSGVGGGVSSVATLGAMMTNVFSKQIGNGIFANIQNSRVDAANEENLKMVQKFAAQGPLTTDNDYMNDAYKQEYQDAQKLLGIVKDLSTEEYNRLNDIRAEKAELEKLQAQMNTFIDTGYDTDRINAQLKLQQKNIDAQNREYIKTQQYTEHILTEITSTNEQLEYQKDNLGYIQQIAATSLVTEESKSLLLNIQNKLNNNEILTEEDLSNLERIELELIQQEIEKQKELNTQKQAAQMLDEGRYNENQARINTLNQEFTSGINDKLQTSAIQKTVQGFTSLIMVLTTVSGLFKTLSDDSLSTSEKLEQIGSTLLITLPMLVMNFSSLVTLVPNVVTAITGMSAAEFIAAQGATTMGGAIWTALAPVLPIILAVSAAIAVVGVTAYELVKAYNADADAAAQAAEQVETLTTRYNELNSAATELKDNISEYDDAIDALKDLEEGTDEYAEALENANDKAKELIETYGLFDDWSMKNGVITIDADALNKALDKAETQANKTQAQLYGAEIVSNQAQLKSNTTDLSRDIGSVVDTGYSTEGGEVFRNFTNNELQNAAQAMTQLTEANNGVALSDEQLKEQMLDMADSLDDAVVDNIDTIITNRQALEDLASSMSQAEEANKYYAEQIMGIVVDDTYGEKFEKMSSDEEGNVNATLYNQLVAATTNALEKGDSNEQSLADAIAAIDVSGATSNAKTNKILKAAGADYQIDDDKDLAMLYAEKVLGYDTTDFTYKSGWNKGTVKDETGTAVVDAVSDDVMRKALARQAQIDQLTEEFAETAADDGTTFVDALDKLTQGADEFGEQFGANITGVLLDALANSDGDISSIDFSSIFADLSQSEVNALSNLNEDDLLEALGLTESDLEALGFGSAEDFKNAWDEGLSEWDSSAWEEKILNSVKSAKSDIESLISDIQSGDITSSNIGESDEYNDLLEQLDNIKEKDEDLTAAADLLGKTWLVGTQEYAEALELVQDKLYAINLEDLIDQANEARDTVNDFISEDTDGVTIDIDADPEAFETAMEDLLNQEYQIDVSIHSEAEQEFDSISNAFDDIKEKASLIGEDFIVAAEDVRALNNTFPGILEGMTTLADGTVKLNEDVVQSAMSMAESEAQADAQATIDKLNNQATLLRAKQQSYQNMANAALVLANAETSSSQEAADAQAVISSELANLKEYNSQESSQSESNNAVEVADSSQVNAGIVASNWQSAYQAMADSSYYAADAAIKNMNAVATGGTATKTTIAVNYSGSTGQSTETSIIDATQNALDSSSNDNSDVWAQLAEQYAELADSAGAAANDIEGMIAQIGATGTDLDKTFSNISSGKGASGDKSSSSSEKDPEVLDYLEDEADRYHDINLEIEELTTNLNRLNKQQDKLYGKDLINNLNDQLEVLEQQKAAYQEKIALAKEEANELRNSLALQGVTFGSDGYISNYASALQAKLSYVNSVIAQYNAMSADEQEKFKDTVTAAKEDYENFKEQIENYDTLISSTIPDLEDDIQDAVDKEIEINISKFTMEVELRLDMAEAERDFNEFKRKVIDGIKDDDILGNATSKLKDYTSYFDTNGSGTGSIQKLTEQVNDTMDEIKQINDSGWSDIYGDDKSQAMEDLQNYYEELMSQLEDVVDLVDEIKESYLDMIDEAVEAFDKQVDQYEYINDLLNHDMNVISLLYGDDAYAQMSQYYTQIEQNNNQELDFLKKRVAYAEEMMNKETDPEAREKWQEEWEDALSELNDKVEDSIQNIIDKYSNTISQVFDELNSKVTSGLGLDYVNDEWDLINKNADQYLDTINAMYAVQELENKYLEAINDTDSSYAQQKLNDLMSEQLDMLRDKEKLTQYDVDRANALYEIALKEIALEEAQQNKSTMRLRRDSQGNYTYQYVADEDSIAQAQQDLLAAQNDLYNLDKDQYKENLNEIYEYYVEFQEKYQEIMTDMSLTDEEKQERALLLTEQYGELINGLVEQNENIKQNLYDSTFMALEGLYAADAQSFQDMTGQDIEAFRNLTDSEKDLVINNLIPQWDSGVQHMADTFAGEGGFIPTCQDAFEQLDDATKDYKESLDDLEEAAGIDFDSISDGYDDNIEKAQELLYANDDLIAKYDEEIDAILDVIGQLDDLIAKYEEAQAAAEAATEAAYAFVAAEKEAAAAAASSSSSGSSSSSSSSGSGSSGSGGSGSSSSKSSSSGDGVPSVGDVVTYTGGLYYYDSYGTKPTGSRGPGKKVTITKVVNGGEATSSQPYPIHVQSSDSAYGWLTKGQISGYDTGGYTGSWGSDGKLAVLHQKELVLNASDTENMLTAIGIVRDMESMLQNLNSSILGRLLELSSGFNTPMSDVSATSDTLEQNVHIEASFPNVSNSKEIEDAFNNLVNIASQHAYNTQR
jgi:TP901 family phage tail tape measure protein